MLAPIIVAAAMYEATDPDPNPEFTEWVKDWNREHPEAKP